ncbi:uncharacterized protein STEHIDRAFT_160243 [Stereum hirsutum FP-91666 SS1]|uniref:uncharacterized protein n=1 Tax=Stereum hirsutum (strain FP-91666) TaxID=721885 RepID=UPI00044499B4|nr:uncharacterized protein STEHIDRAFT_160243 [Stereum hirsutum FP-91666 SS1]EIM83673.1 hypothetical protein STEHIDRAFT_160243 [Stereum hirsutum FP-91666 SS1]
MALYHDSDCDNDDHDLDEMFPVLYNHGSAAQEPTQQHTHMSVDASSPSSLRPTPLSPAATGVASRPIKPLPSRVNANQLMQASLTTFFKIITPEEAEKRRLATKIDWEAKRERMEFARREANLDEMRKKTRTRERERQKKRRCRQRKKEKKVASKTTPTIGNTAVTINNPSVVIFAEASRPSRQFKELGQSKKKKTGRKRKHGATDVIQGNGQPPPRS